MFVGFYPARDYLPLVEFVVVLRDGGSKTLIFSDEQVDAMAEGLPMLRVAMCSGGTSVGVAVATAIHVDWTLLAVAERLVYTSTLSTFPLFYKTSSISAYLVLCNNCAITLWHCKTCCHS